MKPARVFVFVLILLVLSLSALSIYLYIEKGKLFEGKNKLSAEFSGLEKLYLATVDQSKLDSEKNTAEKQSKKYDTYTLLSKCGVGMYIPDEKKRYDPYSVDGVIDGNNRAWRLHSEKVEKVTASDKNPFVDGDRYYVILRNDNEASGYVAGYVSVECIENKAGLDNNTLTTNYLNFVKKGNKTAGVELGESFASLIVKKDESTTKWGTSVDKVTIQRASAGDSYTENGYLFTFGNKMYYIYSFGATTDKKATKAMNSMIESIYLYK